MRYYGLIISVFFTFHQEVCSSARLDASRFTYEGSFKLPLTSGGVSWSFAGNGLTLIPDCLGHADPSPNDGYPGCFGAYANTQTQKFGVFDIVPPKKTSPARSQLVVPAWELNPAFANPRAGSTNYWGALYDKGASHCRIWWTYATWYVTITEDAPFLGYSSCDPSAPNPQGPFAVGDYTENQAIFADPYHTAKMCNGITEVPVGLAPLFGGKRMLLGPGSKGNHPRGGSQGPSYYVRPLQPWTQTGTNISDVTPLLFYVRTSYMKWQVAPQMNGVYGRHWPTSQAFSSAMIDSPHGAAALTTWREPIIDVNEYPCNETNNPYTGQPLMPQPCTVPICWYGVYECNGGNVEQQPSFWDEKSNGELMPTDCRLSAPGELWAGPHCKSQRTFFLFHDVDELSSVFNGQTQHNEPQAYAKVQMPAAMQPQAQSEPHGMLWHDSLQRLFVATGRSDAAVHVFSIGAPNANVCGNGVVEPPEQCDYGVDNGQCMKACSAQCEHNYCTPTITPPPPTQAPPPTVPPSPSVSPTGTPAATTTTPPFVPECQVMEQCAPCLASTRECGWCSALKRCGPLTANCESGWAEQCPSEQTETTSSEASSTVEVTTQTVSSTNSGAVSTDSEVVTSTTVQSTSLLESTSTSSLSTDTSNSLPTSQSTGSVSDDAQEEDPEGGPFDFVAIIAIVAGALVCLLVMSAYSRHRKRVMHGHSESDRINLSFRGQTRSAGSSERSVHRRGGARRSKRSSVAMGTMGSTGSSFRTTTTNRSRPRSLMLQRPLPVPPMN